MNQDKQDIKGSESRDVQSALLLGGTGAKGLGMRVDLVVQPLSDEAEAQFDAEVEALLAHLARQYVQVKGPQNVHPK